MSQRSQHSEAQVATQLTGEASQDSESTHEPIQPEDNPPAGITIFSGPPSASDGGSDRILVPQPPIRQIAIMSTDTPRPRRAGAVFTEEEARQYENITQEFTNQCAYFLNMLGESLPNTPLPAAPAPEDLADPMTRVNYIYSLQDYAQDFDNAAKAARGRTRENGASRRGTAPPPEDSRSRRKFPLPGKYKGGVGDAAITFITQCQNYLKTEGRNWESNYRVRWALQFLEGKAGPWAELQLRRMEEETDDLRDMPVELGNWEEFMKFFKTQWYDSGAIINARKRWKKGFTQTGSAKDYFTIVESLIVRLNYNKDSSEVIDTVFEGLKQHIRTHFALSTWNDFREMKESTIAYDEAYFAQNKRTDPKDIKGKGKRFQKAETAATGSVTKRLSDEDWEMCKIKGLCFVCKKIGRDVLGLAKEHPNHPPKEKGKVVEPKNKKVDSKKPQKKKTASVRATDLEQDTSSDVDRTEVSDSDSEGHEEKTKN